MSDRTGRGLRLLICDSDSRTAQAFRGCPVTVTTARTAARAIPLLAATDALLVEYSLSGAPALIAEARAQNVPALVVSSLDREIYLPDAYAHGADDWIAKPVGVSEVVARVRAIRRRMDAVEKSRPYPMHRWGGMVFEETARTVTVGAARVTLSEREAQFMALLVAAKGAFVSKERIEHVFRDYTSAARGRWVYIHYLRKRLRPLGVGDLIETVPYYGYRLRAVADAMAAAG